MSGRDHWQESPYHEKGRTGWSALRLAGERPKDDYTDVRLLAKFHCGGGECREFTAGADQDGRDGFRSRRTSGITNDS